MGATILPRVIYLYPLNTQALSIVGLSDVTTGTYLDAATVTATLFDGRGNPDPVLNAIPLTYLAGTNGNYQGTIPGTFNPPDWQSGLNMNSLSGYSLEITAAQGGATSLFTIPVILQVRSQQ